MSGKGQIVVGVDGSRFGVEALRWALAKAEHRGCGVLALMVGPGDADQLADEQLAATVRAVPGGQDDPRLTARAVSGRVADTLCAASRDAELLVVAVTATARWPRRCWAAWRGTAFTTRPARSW